MRLDKCLLNNNKFLLINVLMLVGFISCNKNSMTNNHLSIGSSEKPKILHDWGYGENIDTFLAKKYLRSVDAGGYFECVSKKPCKVYKIFGKDISDNTTVLLEVGNNRKISYLSYYKQKARWMSLGQYLDSLELNKNVEVYGDFKPLLVTLISDGPSYWDGIAVWEFDKKVISGSFVCRKQRINLPRQESEIKKCNPISFGFSEKQLDKSKYKSQIKDWKW